MHAYVCIFKSSYKQLEAVILADLVYAVFSMKYVSSGQNEASANFIGLVVFEISNFG